MLSFVGCTGEEKVAYWYVNDAHGNVVGLTNAAGELVLTYAYDAWGNELSSTGTVTTANGAQLLKDANPFRYSGYYYDSTTGLYYLNARYYIPELGRFLSRDPVPGTMIDGLSLNAYLYARNNPVKFTDSSGMAFEDDIAPAFNEVRENPYANLPDSTPLVSYSLHRTIPKYLVTGAFVSALDGIAEFAAKKLRSESKATVIIGKPRIATGTTYVKHTGNILIKKVAAVGVVSMVVNVLDGIKNVQNYGWSEGLGRTGIEVAGTFVAASATAFVVGIMCAPLMPVAAAVVGGVIGYGIGFFVESRVDSIKRFIYGQ